MTESKVIRQIKKGLFTSYKKPLIKKKPKTLVELVKRLQQEENIRVEDHLNKKAAKKKEKVAMDVQTVNISTPSKEVLQLKEEVRELKELMKGMAQNMMASQAIRPIRTLSNQSIY